MKRWLFLNIIFFVLVSNAFTQTKNAIFWKALNIANGHYDIGEYEQASKAYQKAFAIDSAYFYGTYRIFAAASNCMINNEDGVKEHLYGLIPISTKNDMKKVLVNYKIFDKYKDRDWWKTLEDTLNERLEYLIQRHKNLRVFKKGRNLVYTATRINTVGDTIAKTYITMKPDGTGAGGNEANLEQTQIVYEYEYSRQDSIDHIEEVTQMVSKRFWLKLDTTGIIENKEKVWIHPFRHNEFFKAELAPFPIVLFPISKEKMQAHKSKIVIHQNWGMYSGSETENEYEYLGKVSKIYASIGKIECHRFKGIGYNNFHGLSKIDYYFNENLGFVEMNYLTYDNDKIHFKLVEILEE